MSLKTLVASNKPVLKFLLLFFGSYAVLASAYQGFLSYSDFEDHYPDYFTHQVANQSYFIIDYLGYDVSISKTENHPSMSMYIDNKIVARVIEGCNGVSVIILFIAFIIAFYKGLKRTFLYILSGVVIIYIFNVIRVALLTIGLNEFAEYNTLLHDIFFPLFIYGLVLLLWLIWIKNYKKEV